MTKNQFESYYPKYRKVILAIARKLCMEDDDLMQDLTQEGYLALWQLDLTRAKTNEDALIRHAIRNRMVDYLRKQHHKRFESLEARLELGDQVEQVDGSGELTIRRSKHTWAFNEADSDPRVAPLRELDGFDVADEVE